MSTPIRDYYKIADHCRAVREANKAEHLQAMVDRLWSDLGSAGISWLGVYIDRPGEADDRRLVLGPCRDKPACSPIGLHGVCGQALLAGQTLIVRDVKHLGTKYIACDPRDRSEIVVPLLDEFGKPWAVLDVDSWEVGAFDERDAKGLADVLEAAGFRPVRSVRVLDE